MDREKVKRCCHGCGKTVSMLVDAAEEWPYFPYCAKCGKDIIKKKEK